MLKDQDVAAASTIINQGAKRIYQVTDGLRTKHTKKTYQAAFKQFLRDGAKTQDLQVLLDHKSRVLEQMIIGTRVEPIKP
jgi:DNA/RNA-binding domain of Phe-tRNA-synthetase-like protein